MEAKNAEVGGSCRGLEPPAQRGAVERSAEAIAEDVVVGTGEFVMGGEPAEGFGRDVRESGESVPASSWSAPRVDR